MNKIKLTLMTLAVLLSIGAAFATRRSVDCHLSAQYYFNGQTYLPAGVIGQDYGCTIGSATCTYYLVNGSYVACQIGQFVPGNLKAHTKEAK
jgi:hypothetical protein